MRSVLNDLSENPHCLLKCACIKLFMKIQLCTLEEKFTGTIAL